MLRDFVLRLTQSTNAVIIAVAFRISSSKMRLAVVSSIASIVCTSKLETTSMRLGPWEAKQPKISSSIWKPADARIPHGAGMAEARLCATGPMNFSKMSKPLAVGRIFLFGSSSSIYVHIS
jgi:hypothetical protein